MQATLDKIIEEYKVFPQVCAIAIGGSNAGETADTLSDIDIYVFANSDIPISQRVKLIKKYSSKFEAGAEYFGTGDEFLADVSGQQFDVMYWDCSWFSQIVENVWIKHYPSNGYTTAFLYTLNNFKIIYDKIGWLSKLQKSIQTPYPQELKRNIIQRNMMLLKDKPFASYYEQIEKAIKRNDIVSINHRIAAFLASYFDILFAANEILHPGEKRLISYSIKNCKILPQDFELNIRHLLTQPNTKTLEVLKDMVKKLKVQID